ncbi:MAG: hypothetical protein LBJ21_04365 [Acidobacteriota bacterium]|jgi:hypothetical protein|nr:hypothetical protein [Acidobacteriota bacterium]
MKKLKFLPVLGILCAAIMAQNPSSELAAQSTAEPQFEVLSPWADVDPMPLRGLTAPRVNDLAGKKIGIFANYKTAALPSAQAVENQLKAKYPSADISLYHSRDWNVNVIDTKDSAKFSEWVKSNDVLIATIGD